MRILLDDFRIARRHLANAPGFTIASITMLALGIGCSVAMYATLNGVLLRGLPFPESDRIVIVQAHDATQGLADAQLSTVEAEQLANATPGFDSLAFYWWTGVTVFDGEHAREITTQMVGAGYFESLGVEAQLGRRLRAEDIIADRPLAVLSYAEWQRGFGGDPDVIGRRIELVDEPPLEVIGVMPAAMDVFSGDTGVWRPLSKRLLPNDSINRQQRTLFMLGRLQANVSIAQANAALAARFVALREQSTAPPSGWRATARPLLDDLVGDARAALWGALALAVLVLLIAAANVAILFDARQGARRQEQAVMQAIGASRARLWRGLLLELIMVTGAASAFGLAIALISIELLRELARDSIPRVDGIAIDWSMAGLAIVLGSVVPFVAALAGSLRVRGQPVDAIRAGGRGVVGDARHSRLLPSLAMGLSTVSLISALTLAGGLWRLQQVDPGFVADRVDVLQFFRNGRDAFVPFTEQMLERLRAAPGVSAVALTSAPPLSGIGSARVDVAVVGRADAESMQASLRRVSSDYRRLLGTQLLSGRDFDGGDRRGAESVATINRTLARRLFGDASALGQQLRVPIGNDGHVTCRVIAVVDDIRNEGLRAAPVAEILVAFAQHPTNAMSFLTRSNGTGEVAAQVSGVLRAIDPRQSITRQYALADVVANELRPAQFFSRTVGAFAGVALLLAVLGVYAVATLQQQRRIGEFGLRLAIGAQPRDLALDIIGNSIKASTAGVLIGLCVAAFMLQVMDLSVLGIDAEARTTALLAGLLSMAFAAFAAATVPALRAARVLPMQALRDA